MQFVICKFQNKTKAWKIKRLAFRKANAKNEGLKKNEGNTCSKKNDQEYIREVIDRFRDLEKSSEKK